MAIYDTIPCDPDQLPYNYDIDFDGKHYTLLFQYNKFCDQIIVTISDDQGEIAAEPLVLNQILFAEVSYKERLPMVTLIPLDESQIQIEVNIDNLNKTVEIANVDIELDDLGDADG